MEKHSGKYNAQAVISISIMFETERSSEMPYLLRLKWVLSEYPPHQAVDPFLSQSLPYYVHGGV